MTWHLIVGLVLVLYGLLCVVLGLTKKPAWIWNMGKIQGFVKVLSEIGTQIFVFVFGLAAWGFAIWLLILYFG